MTNQKKEPEPRFLSDIQVLALHKREIERHGGAPGIRDHGLLESACAQPKQTMFGDYLHVSIFLKAVAYLYHISQNQPFFDGNKRTGFAAASTFLLLNGYELVDSDEHYQMVIRMAEKELSKEDVAAHFEKFATLVEVPEFSD